MARRDQFLARAALAANQHVDVLRSHAADGLVDLLHRRAAADQAIGARQGGSARGAGPGRRMRQAPNLQGLRDQIADLGEVQRLQQVIEGPQLDRLDRRMAGAAGRYEDHGNARVLLVNLLERDQARLIRQEEIENHYVGMTAVDQFHAGRRRLGRQDVTSVF